ncbi:hypothetical protein AMEX_G14698 [Astyanax mexicanus]|uniref:Uncharacterized protein n=1 Tax=Astyanax mexicanus TaxID=7994 RepID=A0A8T2LJS2_ASTMX|nr:hypothetical protein AMEX_G14698 [Astyanax mexicanus]
MMNESRPELREWITTVEISDKPKAPAKNKIKAPAKNTAKRKAGAKPSKKCVKGYIHNVSKIMLSVKKNKYFTALFQEAKTCSKLLVFKEEHHQEYVSAEENRIPVKLENITRQRTGEKDIIAGWDSKLSSLKKLPFSFDATKKQETNAEHKKIRDILKNPIISQQVHVTVKIKKQLENEIKMTKAKKKCEMTKYKVSDKSGSLDLTLWGKSNLSVGKWYLLQNLSVGEYQEKATLSTTTQTTTEEVEEPGAAAKAKSLTDATNEGLNEVGTGTGGEQENNIA